MSKSHDIQTALMKLFPNLKHRGQPEQAGRQERSIRCHQPVQGAGNRMMAGDDVEPVSGKPKAGMSTGGRKLYDAERQPGPCKTIYMRNK